MLGRKSNAGCRGGSQCPVDQIAQSSENRPVGKILVGQNRPIAQTPARAMADLAAIFLMGALLSKDCASPPAIFLKPLPINALKTKLVSRRSPAEFGRRAFRANLADPETHLSRTGVVS
jgi:hypothetical protein